MLTTTNIITLLTVGVLVSAGIALIVEWVARGMQKTSDGEKTLRESRFRRRAPLAIGWLIALWAFPATWSVVVGELAVERWWHVLGWVAAGTFAGLVAGIGARGAVDIGRAILDKVT